MYWLRRCKESKKTTHALLVAIVAGPLGAIEAGRSLGQRRSGAERNPNFCLVFWVLVWWLEVVGVMLLCVASIPLFNKRCPNA